MHSSFCPISDAMTTDSNKFTRHVAAIIDPRLVHNMGDVGLSYDNLM